MKFLADEGVDAPIVKLLRENNFDVKYILEEFPSSEDQFILNLAVDEQRILITQDKDFGELVFRLNQNHSGVILIRIYGINVDKKAKIVYSAIQAHLSELFESFSVIQENLIRIRK